MKDIEQEESADGKPEYEFDFNSMPIMSKLANLHQDGNYLVGVTEGGTRFRQRIPSDKMLTKNAKGEWAVVPLRGNLG